MHFQSPPHDYTKMVFCAGGRVLDAVVDLAAALRLTSATRCSRCAWIGLPGC